VPATSTLSSVTLPIDASVRLKNTNVCSPAGKSEAMGYLRMAVIGTILATGCPSIHAS
jgi:hypothetical protein